MKNCIAMLFLILLVIITTGASADQTGSSPQAASTNITISEFEVISIKPALQGGIRGFQNFSGGKIVCGFCTLEMVMMEAFDRERFQIIGYPRWGTTDAYSITALPPSSSAPSKQSASSDRSPLTEEQRRMLQALLRDRFRLSFHTESRTGLIYVLTKGSGKLDMTPVDRSEPPWVGSNIGAAIDGDGLAGRNATMTLLAARLSGYLHHPVLDKTDLKGAFDFQYFYLSAQKPDDLVPSILTSVKNLGLTIKEEHGPVETIVIDHVERPSAN